MTLYDLEIFLLTFFVSYLFLAVIIKAIHILTKNKSNEYRIAVVIFSLLAAAMLTYSQLGRQTLDYPSITPTISPEQTQ